MKFVLVIAGLALLGAIYVGCVGFHWSSAEATSSSSADSAATSPVVVELFTSQGCSSCPPADQLLSSLGRDSALADRVIPLAFHVDYWNYIGWSDPFSSKAWTERQYEYSRALDAGVYTPQAVVNGRLELVGSNESGLHDAIVRSRSTEPAKVALQIEPGGGDAIVVAVHVDRGVADADAVILVALFESGVETEVRRGENSGRRLRNDYVVRSLVVARSLKAGERAADARVTVPVSAEWKRANLGMAAFVQNPATMAIDGAAVVGTLPQ